MRLPCCYFALIHCLMLTALRAASNDDLVDRAVLTEPSSTSEILGTTVGAGVESGEINEAAMPADHRDRSVWYEFVAKQTGVVNISIGIKDLTSAAIPGLTLGLAAYIAPAEADVVTMNSLIPAAAGVKTLTDRDKLLQYSGPAWSSLRLWARQGERVVLRVWSRHENQAHAATIGGFGLTWSYGSTATPAGDTPAAALRIFPGRMWGDEFQYELPFGTGKLLTAIDASDCRVEGRYFPAASAIWFRLRLPASGLWRFASAGMGGPPPATLLIARQTASGLHLAAEPGVKVEFSGAAGEEVLIRAGALPVNQNGGWLCGGLAAAGDEPWNATLIQPGTTMQVRTVGSSPSEPHPQDTAVQSGPDLWFRFQARKTQTLQAALQPGEFWWSPNVELTVFDSPGIGAEAGQLRATGLRVWFRVEAGRDYLIRVKLVRVDQLPMSLSLSGETTEPPPNDEPAGAIPLEKADVVLVPGHAAGASIAPGESSAGYSWAWGGRTVWYSIDWPGEAGSWIFAAYGAEALGASTAGAEMHSSRVNVVIRPSEGRVLLRVTSSLDERFLLVGTRIREPEAGLFSRAQPLYAGVTAWQPSRLEAASGWRYWDADMDGLVHLVADGVHRDPEMPVFTGDGEADLQAVRCSTWKGITGFQARSGSRYWFRIDSDGMNTIRLHLRPGGWLSAYDAWLQRFPAWHGIPEFMDPHGDADRDGVSNLLDMALTDAGGVTTPSLGWQPVPVLQNGRVTLSWTPNYAALSGALGGKPLQLSAETSPDMITWQRAEGNSVRLDSPQGKRFARLRVSP